MLTSLKNLSPTAWVILSVAAVALLVNIGMVIISLKANPDLVAPDYYQRGIEYEQTQEKLNRGEQKALTLTLNKEGEYYSLTLASKVDKDLSSFQKDSFLEFYRPSEKELDFKSPLSFSPEQESMLSTPDLQLKPGQWKVIAHLISNNDILLKEFVIFL